MGNENACCESLFFDFVFQKIQDAKPPKQKGVYVIRIKKRGKHINEILPKVEQIVNKLNWPVVAKKICERLHRLEKIKLCPVIYIGSAGTQDSSSNTLWGRYKEFAGRHTAMFPLWALLYFEWELEYGWKEGENPAVLEDRLKAEYKKKHQGELPALVKR